VALSISMEIEMNMLTNNANPFSAENHSQLESNSQKTTIERVNIKKAIFEAPVSVNCTLPLHYTFSPSKAIKRIIDAKQNKDEFIVPCPLFITSRGIDIKTQKETVELSWIRDNEWKFKEVDRSYICKHTKIVDLADYGLPVTSDSAKQITSYLQWYEAINFEHIPVTTNTSQMGWNKEMHCFLLGNDCIVPSSEIDPNEETCPYERQASKPYRFRAIDTGEQQLVESFGIKGTYDQWVEGINTIFEFPIVLFTFYTSLTAPFLKIFGCKNFSYEISSPTSTGKTFALEIAASCWGDPHESTGGFFRTWRNTSTATERILQSVNGIPIIFDDTKNAPGYDKYGKSSTPLVVETIYMVSTGIGKSRGTLTGTEANISYSTIMMSSGESPSIDMTNDGGSRGRIISLWSYPFKKQSKEIRNYISKLDDILRNNYGHAARKIVSFILNNKKDWQIWKEAYEEICRELSNKENLNGVQGRVSENIAAIATAIPLIHAAMPELRRDIDLKAIIDEISELAHKESILEDNGSRFIQILSDYIMGNTNKCLTKLESSKPGQIVLKDFEIYTDYDGSDWSFIGISSELFKYLIKDNQLNKSEVLRTLETKGYLDVNKSSKGSQKQVVITSNSAGSIKKNLYCIKKEAFKANDIDFTCQSC
jgi:uncharacterized protein (DUF927 family)